MASGAQLRCERGISASLPCIRRVSGEVSASSGGRVAGVTSPGAGLSAERIAQAIEDAGLSPLASGVAEEFARYYTLLEQWNSKLNLTAIRDPEEGLRR